MVLTLIFVVIVGVYAATAAVVDVREHRIPNYLTIPAAVLGLAFHTFMPNGYGLWMSLAGLGLGFAVLFVPWLLGGGGMGDVKLLAALGAWLGPAMVLIAFGTSIVAAAAIAMITLFVTSFTKGATETKRKYLALGRRIGGEKRGPRRIVPFAVPVALSTWLVLAWLVFRGGI